jgi:8-oxo-dGTP pyrophosphatase MutT (NUDIX family)
VTPNELAGAPELNATVSDARAAENRQVASVFLLRDDKALLLQHRDNKPGLPLAGKWAPPGGHCEKNEDLQACARRELSEETGYQCERLTKLGSFIDDNVAGHPAYPLTVFWALYDGRQTLHCHEGQALKFVERHETDAYDVPKYLISIWDRAIAAMNKAKMKETTSEE